MEISISNPSNKQLPDTYRQLTEYELDTKIRKAKASLGKDLIILGHHYQREDVIIYADYCGDSLLLAQKGAEQTKAPFIIFCGVYFMAETADILSQSGQKVLLPDMRAGCTMADMANIEDLEEAWECLTNQFNQNIIPVTYVNSSAEIKAFVGKKGGATCTSSNAASVLKWAWNKKEKILFLPDQHLGRNIAYELGVPLDEMPLWSYLDGKLSDLKTNPQDIKIILWEGHCSVHQRFNGHHIKNWRQNDPERKIIVHPECSFEVARNADYVGSTEFIKKTIEQSEEGTSWAIGTEANLVQRLANQNKNKDIKLLSSTTCQCLTMNRIDRQHLLWALDSILDNKPINIIKVPEEQKYWSKKAIDQMLMIS